LFFGLPRARSEMQHDNVCATRRLHSEMPVQNAARSVSQELARAARCRSLVEQPASRSR